MSKKRPYGKQLFFTSIACLAFFFWMCFFIQTLRANPLSDNLSNAIPAFLNTDSQASSYDITEPFTHKGSKELCRLNQTTSRISISSLSCKEQKDSFKANDVTALLKEFDRHTILISHHKEKTYTDFYFYSPRLAEMQGSSSDRNFNLQAAVTKKYVYLGIPLISYDF